MTLMQANQLGVAFEQGPSWNRRAFHALRDIDLMIGEGEVVGVVGESGSGKSTLGNAMIGRIRPTSGHVLYRGRPFGELARSQRAGVFAAVLQHPKWSLNPMMRVRTSVLEPARIAGQSLRGALGDHAAGDMLERVGLPGDYQFKYPHQLSGGQRQRVSIARALITDPRFVLFDEAVSALDVSVQAQILNLIRELQCKRGFSALFISHDLAATRYVSSRILVMYAGRVVEEAPAAAFYQSATHPYARGLQFASGLLDDAASELSNASLDASGSGCPLAQRCPLRASLCDAANPILTGTGDHRVACHMRQVES